MESKKTKNEFVEILDNALEAGKQVLEELKIANKMKDCAVEFAEWISEQGYWPPAKDQWMKSHFENNKTTAELYTIFKQQNEK